ncbi:Transposase family tnp2 [Ceratobasidium sp. AG-Ba]|nr:Transposase family tnp2 [Ceratobasidium sp. AG-Ba]QRW14381.1 Transposase family tnp2 [Ceratobasidium sp. AG-Ba]
MSKYDGMEIIKARRQAQKSKRSIAESLGELAFCDCNKCYKRRVKLPISKIQTHRQIYGRHVLLPAAGASHPPGQQPPTRSPSISHSNSGSDSGLIQSRTNSRSRSRSCSRSYSRSLSRSLSQSGSGSRPNSGSRSSSPVINEIQLIQPPEDFEGQAEEVVLHIPEPDVDAEFYRNLLGENNIAQPPPLNVEPDQDNPENEQGARGDNLEDEIARAARADEGDEEPDGGDVGPEDDNGRPEQHNPEIFVPQPDLGGEPDPGDEGNGCAAFDEHPTLRNIYLRTWVGAAFSGVTHDQIQSELKSHKLSLESLANVAHLPEDLANGLESMPQMLRALERRIGMDFSDLMTTFVLCPKCGKRYTYEEMNALLDPQCIQDHADPRCEGVIYSITHLADGTRKRTPSKTFPYIPVPAALGRLLSRPGIAEIMQHWRKDGDEPDENARPLQAADWLEGMPPNRRFGDITEAWGWQTHMTGIQRDWDAQEGVYADEPTGEQPLSLSRQPLGLSLGLSMDGFQAFRGKFSRGGPYSVNGVYIVVNNLPYFLRTLIENMILAIVIPGPNEPSGYAMDEILKPLVDDLIELINGSQLPVYNIETGRTELRTVYAKLSIMVLDWQARVKCTGHVAITSEYEHCLYCHMRQCFLSTEQGYQSAGYDLWDPMEHLQLKHQWLREPDRDNREQMRVENGTRFVEFDRIPGFFSFDNCPINAMHLFDHGVTPAIVRDIIYLPGMLAERYRGQPYDQTPEARFDTFIARTYFPSHCGRLPPKISRMGTGMKAEQWRTLLTVLPGALFDAWQVDGVIPEGMIPRGRQNSKIFKAQTSNAKKLLRQRRHVHEELNRDPDDEPTLEDCRASREPREYMQNVLRYCVAYRNLFRHRITRAEVEEMSILLERMGEMFTRMNVYMTQSFHSTTHVGDDLLKHGNAFGTWMYPYERGNRVLISTNLNGHGQGTLEATMAKGWMRRTECYRLVRRMQAIENPSPDDIATTEVLLKAMRNGPEHEQQRGMLNAVLAGEAQFQGQELVRLATSSKQVDFRHRNDEPFYQMFINFCSDQIPGVVFYGGGNHGDNDIYFPRVGSTQSYPHFLHYGIRYGSADHHRGKKSRYGYINDHVPVLVRRIYKATLDVRGEEHEILGVVVQRFVRAQQRPILCWNHWEHRVQIYAWAYNQLDPPEVVRPNDFSGVFALSDIRLPYGHYWLTFSLIHTEPEDLNDDE